MTKLIGVHLAVGAFILSLAPGILPAEGYLAQESVPGGPQFYYLTANRPSEDLTVSHLTVYIAVSNRQLQFRSLNEIFQAAYAVAITIQQNNQQIAGTRWRRRITTKDYATALSFNEFDLSEGTLSLSPGDYRLVIELEDEETRKTSRITRDLRVRDFSRELRVSDVLFVRSGGSPDSIEAGNIVFPELGNEEEFKAWVDISTPEGQTVDIQWKVMGPQEKVFAQEAYRRPVEGGKPFTERISVPRDSLPPGHYVFQVWVKGPTEEDHSMRMFYIRHKGQILPEENIDQGVEQLRYIAHPDEWHRMMMAPEEEKRTLFQNFWNQYDPTPDTPENELMEEYYTRVGYANQEFSAGKAGWRTDRGAIYIIYGPPDNVQRRSLWDKMGQERSYEIWQYKEIARKFVFLYDPLMGDFRLTSEQ